MMFNMSLARRDFFNGDSTLARRLDRPVYDSWQRCLANQQPMDGDVEYGFLSDGHLKDCLLFQRPLLDSSQPHLEALYRSISGAGWSVLFTDAHCNALKVFQTKNLAERRIMQAFRQGAVLSEERIGTSAMSCAIASRRLVSVFGEEHYKTFHRNFNCVAVPVFDPLGEVCGSIDLTNEAPQRDPSAFYLLESCAQNIQAELIRAMPDAIVIDLQLGGGRLINEHIILAFGYDQRLIGANQVAQRFFNLDLRRQRVDFNSLFEDDFALLFDKGVLKNEPFDLTLATGIQVLGRVLNFSDQERGIATSLTDRKIDAGPSECPAPCFGDRAIHEAVQRGLKAVSRLPILLLGESGVGKEVVARYIHQASPGRKGAFVSLNCAAIPESLIESELFGYERGAFTGANREGRTGKVQQANGGTLFLDEIGDMPATLQTRLLRVLETREVVRLGASEAEQVNFQLICATHRNLPEAIQSGVFRQDLFYRINGYEVEIPALRDRENIADVATAILTEVSQGKRRFSGDALAAIAEYTWPGNVRELRNAIVFADTLADPGEPLQLADFPQEMVRSVRQARSQERKDKGVLESRSDEVILEALERCGGNKTRAADYLGIGRATLYRRMMKMN
jgi:transcriptional regulator of acetoin/glycerol metabolism